MNSQTRRRFVIIGLAILALAGGYTLLWWKLATTVRAHVVDWQSSEAARGKHWTCDNPRLSGFPFAIIAECSAPRLEQETSSGTVVVGAQKLSAQSRLLEPMSVLIEVRGPARLLLPEGDLLAGDWTWLSVTLHWRPGALREAAITLNGLSVHEGSMNLSSWNGSSAGQIQARLRPQAATGYQNWLVDIGIQSARIAPLDEASGSTELIDAQIAAEAANPEFEAQSSWLSTLDEWQRNQGRIMVTTASLAKGSLRIEGNGLLALDSERRLSGAVNGRAAGLEPLLKSSGFRTGSLPMDAMIRGMLAREPKNGVPIALSFKDGRVYLGPLRTNIQLHPLY